MKIKILGDPFSISGYSQHCREVMLALIEAGHNLTLRLVQQDKERDLDFVGSRELRKCIDKNIHTDVSLQIVIPEAFNPSLCKYNIGLFFFEADKLSQKWVDLCNKMSAIIAPSEFCRDIYIGSGVTVPVLLAHGYHVKPEQPKIKVNWRETLGVTEKTTVFLSVFQWGYRKGQDVLLRAFWSEFSKDEDVELVIKSWGMDTSPESRRSIREDIQSYKGMHGMTPPGGKKPVAPDFKDVNLITSRLTSDTMYWLYEACDCFVLPTRGEGWGRPFAEAALHEKPIIATDWSAHLEFLNHGNAYLVDADYEPCVMMHPARYPITSNFASPSIHVLKQYMRLVHEKKTTGGELIRPISSDVLIFSKKRCVEEHIAAIQSVLPKEAEVTNV